MFVDKPQHAQDPNQQPKNEASAEQSFDHAKYGPEAVLREVDKTPLGDSMHYDAERDFVHVPTEVPENLMDPNYGFPPKNTGNIPFWTRGKKIGVAVAAFVTVSAAAFGATQLGGSNDKDAPRANGGDKAASAPEVPGVATAETTVTPAAQPGVAETTQPTIDLTDDQMKTMSSEMFAELSLNQRMDYYMPKIDQWRSDTWKIMQGYLTPEQKGIINDNLPSDKSQYTNQDILNAFSIDTFDASIQGDKPEDKVEGKKMIATIVDNNNENQTDLLKAIDNGASFGVYKEDTSYNYQSNGILRNVDIRGMHIGEGGARAIRVDTVGSTKQSFTMFFEYIQTPDGQTGWQYRASFDADDHNISSDIGTAAGKSHS